MAVLPTGIGPVTGGYQIERSLRFNSADSAYLNRTPASAGNRKTWTWSGWVKRGALGTDQWVLAVGGSTEYTIVRFNTTNTLEYDRVVSSAIDAQKISTAVYRDPSAWYHIVIVEDALNTVARIYVNGSEVAYSTNDNPSNVNGAVNNTVVHTMSGVLSGVGTNYFNGYMTEINFIDGQALTPSDFGETDTDTGVWKPKAYSGTYGTNGFFLNFSDNSGTTSTTLGKDSSGNGNNWTPNNFSVTAGAGNDSMVDSPTAYGTDTGAGGSVRGNYCTWNPLDATGNATLSNGNLQGVTVGVNGRKGTIAASSGKWYWEATCISGDYAGVGLRFGIDNISTPVGSGVRPGNTATSYVYTSWNGRKNNNSTSTAYGSTYTTNDVISVALDLDNGRIWWAKNGVWQASGDPAAGTNAAFTGISGSYTAIFGDDTGGGITIGINFGQRAFAYTAPSGFKALCTTNLPTPTIGATSTTLAGKYFNAVPYTATENVASSITGVGFQPDFVWVKTRADAASHALTDAVRGVEKALFTNTTGAEVTSSTYLTSFNSDGFTQGGAGNFARNSLVAWNWNAGGSNATNTSGTITSTVRANTTSGFSIATFTKNATTSETIGHGLGVAPSMIIVKTRQSSGYTSWAVWHTSIGIGNYLELNTTAASQASSTIWNNTLPTSTVFSMGTAWTNTQNMVAYCFAPVAGYSAFGSYTGNGSADGPFVYTNFRPRWIMYKRTDTSGSSWVVIDTARDTYNYSDKELYPNLSNSENTGSARIDILSNGYKIRSDSTYGYINASGGTYIYMALAESPFKFSLAR
jgi:hypothetical protein